MKVLILGSGGREHAIAWKLKQSEQVEQVFVAPGNAGMLEVATLIAQDDPESLKSLVQQEQIGLVFVGQEKYLVEGASEWFDCPVLGPSAQAAQLEGSKVFAKQFMHKYSIPTAKYRESSDYQGAVDLLAEFQAPYVIKASGLAAGKGVAICQNEEEAKQQLKAIMVDKVFGEAGQTVVIEEYLTGEEASYFIMTDGKDFVPLASCQDYKRIGELDQGPNTGGMGSISPAPVVTPAVEQAIIDQVVRPTIAGMAKDGHPYQGVLYIGLMIQDDQPKVIEYNVRLGDPECQPIMMRLQSDFLDLALATATGKLAEVQPQWSSQSAASVTLASKGYPQTSTKGTLINGLDELFPEETEGTLKVFHAGTKADGTCFRTNGGRVLNVTALGETLESALNLAYSKVDAIHFTGKTYRRDIGLQALLHFRHNRPEISVGILIGSASDLKIAQKASEVLKKFEVGHRIVVSSAHRSPIRTKQVVRKFESEGAEVFIAMAGMAAHLPGVLAAETNRPVIGVPVGTSMDGLDALLAIAQMPPGVPVACMAVDGGNNAGVLAVQILATKYTDLRARLRLNQIERAQKVAKAHNDAGLEPV